MGDWPDGLPTPAPPAGRLVFRRYPGGRVTADGFPDEADVCEALVARLAPALAAAVRLERGRLYVEAANGAAVYVPVGPSRGRVAPATAACTGGWPTAEPRPAPAAGGARGTAGSTVARALQRRHRTAGRARRRGHRMDAQAQDVVLWLLLVGVTAVGAVLAGLAQRHWWETPVNGRWGHRRR